MNRPTPLCNCSPCQREAAAKNAPIPYLRRQVAEAVFDALEEQQRDRGVTPIHTGSDADAAAAAVVALVGPALDTLAWLHAEAVWQRNENAKVWAVTQQDLDGTLSRLHETRVERNALRAQLATAVFVWPKDAMVRIRECIADPSRMVVRSFISGETVAGWGARAVVELMESWRAPGSEPVLPTPACTSRKRYTLPGWKRAHYIEQTGSLGAIELWATECNRSYDLPDPEVDEPIEAPASMPLCTPCAKEVHGRVPRVWNRGDDEPADHPQVRDCHGDVWTWVPGTFEWSSPETQNCAWSYMARKWAPLTEVLEGGRG